MRAFEQRKKNSTGSSSFFGPKIQKKLKTGTPGDQFEVEADKVADQVVSNNNSAGGGILQSKEEIQQKPLSETITSVQSKGLKEEEPVQKKTEEKEDKLQKKEEEKEPVQKKAEEKEEKVQAKCDDCEKEDKGKKVQKKENGTNSKDDSDVEGKLSQSRGSGSPMDKNVKAEMESKFGSDFSNVNIHTNSNAVQMSQDLGAQAFTNGNDVYFNKGKYNPNSKEGKHLLAHELTHTIQQTGAKQKTPSIQKSLENHEDNLKSPEDPYFKDNPPLEKTNDNEMLIGTGHKAPYVAEIQSGLMKAGQNLNKFGADGDFGSETRNAVYNFQVENELKGKDGIVGPETISALDNKMVGQKGGGNENECCAEAFQLPQNDNTFNINESVLSQQTFCTKGNFKITSTANWVSPHRASHYHIVITAMQGGTVNKPTRRFDIGRSETQSFTVTTKDCFFFKVEVRVINPPGSPNLAGSFNVTK